MFGFAVDSEVGFFVQGFTSAETGGDLDDGGELATRRVRAAMKRAEPARIMALSSLSTPRTSWSTAPLLPIETRKGAAHPSKKRETGSLYEVSHITGRNTVSDDATRDRVTEDSPARKAPI